MGDDGAVRDATFERLWAEHARALYSFLAYRVGDRTRAEDLLGDTFERALRARRPLDPRRGSERAWLYAIALNLVRDDARRRGVEARALEGVAAAPGGWGASEPADAVALRDEVARALHVLSDDEREAVALRFGADLTVPEMARVLREPLTTVEGRVYRALRKLRAELGGSGA
jgi:RNA polymerase sigma-70 factor (ECF subfamily)